MTSKQISVLLPLLHITYGQSWYFPVCSVESTALRLIMGLGSGEVQPQLSRVFSEPKTLTLLSSESEELNRALVLTLARSLHVTGQCHSTEQYLARKGTWY